LPETSRMKSGKCSVMNDGHFTHDKAVSMARSFYAKETERIHRAGLLASGYKRDTGQPSYPVGQWHTFVDGYERLGRLPVTVARLRRICTDFPILPEHTFRPPDENKV
jgi:hypothetical protein